MYDTADWIERAKLGVGKLQSRSKTQLMGALSLLCIRVSFYLLEVGRAVAGVKHWDCKAYLIIRRCGICSYDRH